jgi:chemotaxis response regulator CheB
MIKALSRAGLARRVLIVDEHPIVRLGLRRVIEREQDLTVCGEAENASDTRTAIAELSPDLLICEISLKQSDGIELVRYVRAHHPQLPILVLSTLDEAIYAVRRRKRLHHQGGAERAVSGIVAPRSEWRHLRVGGRRPQHDP